MQGFDKAKLGKVGKTPSNRISLGKMQRGVRHLPSRCSRTRKNDVPEHPRHHHREEATRENTEDEIRRHGESTDLELREAPHLR